MGCGVTAVQLPALWANLELGQTTKQVIVQVYLHCSSESSGTGQGVPSSVASLVCAKNSRNFMRMHLDIQDSLGFLADVKFAAVTEHLQAEGPRGAVVWDAYPGLCQRSKSSGGKNRQTLGCFAMRSKTVQKKS